MELWARDSGRHARLHCSPNGTWFVRLTLKSTDSRMKLWQEGFAEEPPGEDVWLHIPNPRAGQDYLGVLQGDYIPLDINHLGVEKLREFLEQGDTWSGRGQYLSLMDQLRKVRQNNDDFRVDHRAHHREESRYEMRQTRRFRLKIPFLRPKGGWLTLKASTSQQKEQ